MTEPGSRRTGARVRVLVSVRDEAEARAAAAAGADLIDLKDPAAGALGGLSVARIRDVLAALREARAVQPVSATIGDVLPARRDEIFERVAAVADAGVDLVKVGVAPDPDAVALIHALARCGAPVVPVLLSDAGIRFDLVEAALGHDAFPAVMLDLAGKTGGSLMQRLGRADLERYVVAARARGTLCGVAGALMLDDVHALQALAPDFAGFRTAVCRGDRAGTLEPLRVRELRARLGGGVRP
jgi:uncharacterized protein (UPF0264 family)